MFFFFFTFSFLTFKLLTVPIDDFVYFTSEQLSNIPVETLREIPTSVILQFNGVLDTYLTDEQKAAMTEAQKTIMASMSKNKANVDLFLEKKKKEWAARDALETATIELKEGQVTAGISETELSVLETKQKKTQEEYVAAESNAQVAEDDLIKIETDGSDRSSENNYVVLTILGIVGLALVLVGGVLIGFTRWKSFKDAPKRRTPTKEQPAIGVVADTKATNLEMGRNTRLGIMLKSNGFSQV